MRGKTFMALLALLVWVAGCGGDQSALQMTPTTVVKTPEALLDPKATDEAPAKKAAEKDKPASTSEKTADEKTGPETAAGAAVEVKDLAANSAPESDAVRLVSMTYDEYRSKAVVDPKAKLIVVDAWATWCPPCMENFPHLVEMHKKYAGLGLKCVSLSLDFPDDPKSFEKATQFLREQKATFLNVLLNEEQGDAFDKLDVNGVPSVFLYDGTGNEVRRFTMDDPNRQFTYDQVDEIVAKLLKGEKLPEDAPGEVYVPRRK